MYRFARSLDSRNNTADLIAEHMFCEAYHTLTMFTYHRIHTHFPPI